MSILVSGIVLPWNGTEAEASALALKKLGLRQGRSAPVAVHKLSFDFRHGTPSRIYSMEVFLGDGEAELVQKRNDPQIRLRASSALPRPTGKESLDHPPVIVGFGPAGMFAALVLAKNGYRPIVLERGDSLEVRDKKVDAFFQGGSLDPQSNIQFGEGGAGAYSDGKLTTRINDPRCELVLRLLKEHGAPADALSVAKPHIGTDLLKGIVVSIRNEIKSCGGEVCFNSSMQQLVLRNGKLTAVETAAGTVPCETAVLALGHSARDSFGTLLNQGLHLERKAFSVGVRAEHLQETIDRALYGKYAGMSWLPKGEYSLSWKKGDRACYSFCMCPGGQVVAAASEEGRLVVNGMSYHARDGKNANAALCVSVNPSDFSGSHPLAGMEFQRKLEQTAFQAGGGDYTAPVQLWGDFAKGIKSKKLGNVTPTYPRGYSFAALDTVLPDFVCEMLREAMPVFGRKLRGYDAYDTVFTGVETRTSSPVRLLRNEALQSTSISGVYPCGEGAGYAGGIMSAAVDGIRVAEAIMAEYAPIEKE